MIQAEKTAAGRAHSTSTSPAEHYRQHACATMGAFPWRRLLVMDSAWFGAAVLVALATGTVGDQLFRRPPLGWHYQSAAQRLLASPSSGTLSLTPINLVTLEEVEALIAKPGIVVLDARPRVFYEIGHLPRALSLSREQFDGDFERLEPALRVPGQTLLIYCSDVSCEDGPLVARALQERGLGPLLLFPGGLAEWEAAGRPQETVP